MSFGGAASSIRVAEEIRGDYDGPPASWLAFLSVKAH
jgi:hypothetical protein